MLDYEHVEKLLNNILIEFYHEEGPLIQGLEYFLGACPTMRSYEKIGH